MQKLAATLKHRLDAELVSYCDILGVCISYKAKHPDSFRPEGQYMFHSYSVDGNNCDIFWGHYDLTIVEALATWKSKIENSPAGYRK